MAKVDNKSNLVLHRIRSGENISQIARKYNVSPERIIAWNNLKNGHNISIGQQLALYPNNRALMTVSEETIVASADRDDEPTVASSHMKIRKTRFLTSSKKKVSHAVATRTPVPKKAPIQIAEKRKTSNGILAQSTRIRTIPALTIEKKRTPATLVASPKTTSQTNTILIAQKKKIRNSVAANDRNYKLYKVQDGDTLWTISQKFKTSLVLIKQWNNMKSDIIQPGSQLKLKNA